MATSKTLSADDLSLMPSEEELKPLDEITKKFNAQKLRILYYPEPARTRLGRFLDFLSPPPIDTLLGDFAQAVREYERLKIVVKDRIQSYERNPNFENLQSVHRSIVSFHEAVKWLNGLYYQALGQHRVDEGLGKELDRLKAEALQYEAKIKDLTDKLAECEKNLEGLRKRLPDMSEFGDVSS